MVRFDLLPTPIAGFLQAALHLRSFVQSLLQVEAGVDTPASALNLQPF